MSDLTRRSDELDERMKDVPIENMVHKLVTSGRRHRIAIIISAIGIALDLILSVFLVSAHRRTATLEQSALQSCLSSNETRSQQRNLWAVVIKLSDQTIRTETPAQKAQRRLQSQQFARYIEFVFAPRNCEALKDGQSGAVTPSPSPVPVLTPTPALTPFLVP